MTEKISGHVEWFVKFDINEGKIGDLKSLMHDMISSTKNEDGVLIYEWHFNDDETAVLIHERYTNSEAVLAHMNNFGAFAERFIAAVSNKKMYMLGKPEQAVKEIFGTEGVTYMPTNKGFAKLG